MLDIRPKNSLDIGCFVGAVSIETSLSAVKWVSNISYILTKKGCLYLAVGLELNFLPVIA